MTIENVKFNEKLSPVAQCFEKTLFHCFQKLF